MFLGGLHTKKAVRVPPFPIIKFLNFKILYVMISIFAQSPTRRGRTRIRGIRGGK